MARNDDKRRPPPKGRPTAKAPAGYEADDVPSGGVPHQGKPRGPAPRRNDHRPAPKGHRPNPTPAGPRMRQDPRGAPQGGRAPVRRPGSRPPNARPPDGRPPNPRTPSPKPFDRQFQGKPQFGTRPPKRVVPDGPVTHMRSRKPRPFDRRYAAPSAITVLYEDGDVIAVDKPAGINVAIENETETVTSLQTMVSTYLEEKGEGSALLGPRARLVHRVDKDTTGVVLFAKNPRAQSSLTKDWESGRVEKVYLAIVRGTPEAASHEDSFLVIDTPIGRDTERKDRRGVNGLDPQPARTRWRVLETFGKYSLVEVQPLTGRTHQIRVHMKSIGHPLAVDRLYGEPNAEPPEGIRRLTLHAKSLAITTPAGKKITAEAKLPRDFVAALEALRVPG